MTLWAAHSKATKALKCRYDKIRIILEQFAEKFQLDETSKARQEPRGILSKFNTLEN